MVIAMMIGATGFCGAAIYRALVKDPFFAKVHVRGSLPFLELMKVKVHAQFIDFDGKVNHFSQTHDHIKIDVIFLCLGPRDDLPHIAAQKNQKFLRGFLESLKCRDPDKGPRRIVLTLDFSRYGPHMGRMKQPCEETDPVVTGDLAGVSWPWALCNELQKILEEYEREDNWDWVITYAHNLMGLAFDYAPNPLAALGIYCAISKATPGSELPFPGNIDSYLALNTWVSTRHLAEFCLWAAKTPSAGNQAFNVTNGDVDSFQNLWPKLARHFGCKVPDPMFPDWRRVFDVNYPHRKNGSLKGFKDYDAQHFKAQGPGHNPLLIHAESMGLSGTPVVTTPPKFHMQIDMQRWAQSPAANLAWHRLCEKYNKLKTSVLQDLEWNTMSWVLGSDWPCVSSMSKARKLGWNGYADTWDELLDIFEQMKDEGFLPAVEQLKEDFGGENAFVPILPSVEGEDVGSEKASVSTLPSGKKEEEGTGSDKTSMSAVPSIKVEDVASEKSSSSTLSQVKKDVDNQRASLPTLPSIKEEETPEPKESAPMSLSTPKTPGRKRKRGE